MSYERQSHSSAISLAETLFETSFVILLRCGEGCIASNGTESKHRRRGSLSVILSYVVSLVRKRADFVVEKLICLD